MSNEQRPDLVEGELAALLGARLETLRLLRADCPPLASLRMLAAETLPGAMAVDVRQHVAGCGTCAALAADLQDEELTAPTAAEAQRILARVMADAQAASPVITADRSPRSSIRRITFFGPLLAIAALFIVFVWINRDSSAPAPVQTVTEVSPQAPALPAALRLDMPDLKISAAAALVTRGDGGQEQFLKDLAAPFDAYRAGRYADAGRLFAVLEAKYPKATEVFLYGGVSRLHERDWDQALDRLERARALGEPEFAGEISFYRALALQRAGRAEAARLEFDTVCAAKTELSPRACDAARALAGSTPR